MEVGQWVTSPVVCGVRMFGLMSQGHAGMRKRRGVGEGRRVGMDVNEVCQ